MKKQLNGFRFLQIGNDLYITKGSFTPGETCTSGCGIYEGYVYLVDFEVNGENHYYKVPIHRFKTTNN